MIGDLTSLAPHERLPEILVVWELYSMLCAKWEGNLKNWGDIHVYIELIHFSVQQKVTQHCKATALQ